MRSSRSRSGSRAGASPLIASLALHAALFAVLARMPRGETRAAAALGFEAEIAVAWVASLDAAGEKEAFAEPAPLVQEELPPPPLPPPEIDPLLVEMDPEPSSDAAGELEPDPSFTELPVSEESLQSPPPPSDWMEPRLAGYRLPARPARDKELEPRIAAGEAAPAGETMANGDAPTATSGGPDAAKPTGRVLSAVARSHGNAAPDYPREARRKGIEGVVLLRVAIAADGSCSRVTIETSSGCEALDAAAVAAVRKWKFEPALQEGVAIASELLVPIRFVLKAGGAG